MIILPNACKANWPTYLKRRVEKDGQLSKVVTSMDGFQFLLNLKRESIPYANGDELMITMLRSNYVQVRLPWHTPIGLPKCKHLPGVTIIDGEIVKIPNGLSFAGAIEIVAHLTVEDPWSAPHGRAFARQTIVLTRKFLGREWANELRKIYTDNKVKARVFTEEGKQARLRAYSAMPSSPFEAKKIMSDLLKELANE